jgi:hypothetical protein
VRNRDAQRYTKVGLRLQNLHLRRFSTSPNEALPCHRIKPLTEDNELRPIQRSHLTSRKHSCQSESMWLIKNAGGCMTVPAKWTAIILITVTEIKRQDSRVV